MSFQISYQIFGKGLKLLLYSVRILSFYLDLIKLSGGSKGVGVGGGNTGHIPPPPLEPSNAVLLGRGLAVATYICLTSYLLPPESRLLAS